MVQWIIMKKKILSSDVLQRLIRSQIDFDIDVNCQTEYAIFEELLNL